MAKCALLPALAISAAVGAIPAAAEEIGDATRGATLFRQQCSACHQIGPDAVNRVGPALSGIFGRRAGGAPDFNYSKSMARMGSDGLTWTLETLDAYVENPKSLVTGTRMNYKGMADPEARSALLAKLGRGGDGEEASAEWRPASLEDVASAARSRGGPR